MKLITQSLHSPVTSSLLGAMELHGQKLNSSEHVWREHPISNFIWISSEVSKM